jgi:hypothetical protein
MKRLLVFAVCLLIASAASAGSSINNDDTCDIKVGPAATLLLPYFEVDVFGNSGQTTLFTITNVSRYPQIAHVTLWTDWAVPVFTFNIYLTGYDVQSINLTEVLIRGVIASPNGTTDATQPGALSSAGSPNLGAAPNCGNNPGVVPAAAMALVRKALTTGMAPPINGSCGPIGGIHINAIGYATVDVVSNCTARFPSDPAYFTDDLLYDNVLIGDYQQLGPHPGGTPTGSFDGAGNPMVHIRAVPEGGSSGSNVPTALPYTFYDRYTPATARTRDRRQPLPSTFAARYIQGGRSEFETNVTIWREGFGSGSCTGAMASGSMLIPEIVRFDEHENPVIGNGLICGDPCVFQPTPTLPTTSSSNTAGSVFPFVTSGDVGGWIYLNLNNGGSTTYSVTRDAGGQPGPTNLTSALAPLGSTTTAGPRPSQNWVTVTMFGTVGGNRMTAEFDAASLGNGCSPAAFFSAANGGSVPIGPSGGVFVCPPGPTLTNGTTTQCTGTNVNPKP